MTVGFFNSAKTRRRRIIFQEEGLSDESIEERNSKLYCGNCGYKFKNESEASMSYCLGCCEGLTHEEYPGDFYDDSCMQEADNLLRSAWIDLHKVN